MDVIFHHLRGRTMPRSAVQSFQRYLLTQVLGTEANVRLLRELTLHGGQLSAPSLVARTGMAKGSVRTGLDALLAFGMVVMRGSGNARLYSLRTDHPLCGPIEALFEAERTRFDAVREVIRAAAQELEPVLVAAYVYGSVARGQDRPDSDLDVLVVAQDEARVSAMTAAMRKSLEAPAERIGFLPSVIGLSQDDVARFMRDLQSPWKAALQNALVISGMDPGSLARAAGVRHAEPAA